MLRCAALMVTCYLLQGESFFTRQYGSSVQSFRTVASQLALNLRVVCIDFEGGLQSGKSLACIHLDHTVFGLYNRLISGSDVFHLIELLCSKWCREIRHVSSML